MPHPPQIPLTSQTDERNFPRWEGENAPFGRPGHRYPKMLTKVCTPSDRKEWVEKHRRIDQNTRQEYWETAPPRVGSPIPMEANAILVDAGIAPYVGAPLVADNKEQEAEILKALGLWDEVPQPPKTVSIPVAAAQPAKKRGRPRKPVAESSNEVSELE